MEPILDHIVILVSHNTLLALPALLSSSLNTIVGGTHGDGRTTNCLVLLPDGVYIEVIAFVEGIDPARRDAHRWGRETENTVVDWALTLPQAEQFADVRRRIDVAGGELEYGPAVPGGRTRPDGVKLEWEVVAAQRRKQPDEQRDGDQEDRLVPGLLPFWCLDKTPRHLRVPYQDNPLAQHPSGARGVHSVRVRCQPGELSKLRPALEAIHTRSPGESDAPADEPGDAVGTGSRWQGRFRTLSGPPDDDRLLEVVEAEEGPRIEFTLLGDGGPNKVQSIELAPGLRIKIVSQ
jgi:hypothetical protein